MTSLLLSTALGYNLMDADWSWQQDPYAQPLVVDTDSFPASTGSPTEITGAFQDGLDAWNGIAGIDLQIDSDRTGLEHNSSDGEMVLHWDPQTADGSVIATASSWGYSGTMMDCDIAYWAANEWGTIDWDTEENTWTVDLAEVTTHEVGHCIGLDHSDEWNALMAPTARGYRGLHSDDEAGLRAMYPEATDADGDGFDDDCNDNDPSIRPGAVEVCDGVDNNCDGAVDEVAFSSVAFGAGGSESAQRWSSSWLTLFDVEASTALHNFRQTITLEEDQHVSFSVIDTTSTPVKRTVFVEFHTAGTATLESPPFDLALEAGHTYAIGIGTLDYARYAYTHGVQGEQRGLRPVGARWESYAPQIDGPTTPHNVHIPQIELTLADQDLDGDGTTAFCGDCDDLDPNAIAPADCAPPPDPEPDPTPDPEPPPSSEEGESGCGSSATHVLSLMGTWLGLRRR